MLKRTVTLFLIAIVCTMALFISPSYAADGEEQNNHMDVVLVIDTSNSMNGNDPEHIAVEGVKLFIDMIESNGSRVGIIGFNGRVMFKAPLTPLNSIQDKEELKRQVDQITYTGYTDIGLALKEAEQMLYSQKSDRQPLIVFFTDGYVEVDPKTGRTNQQSENEINQVILGAQSHYSIYTIGLNASNRVDKDLIEQIADKTGGLSFMTASASGLTEFFQEVFARSIQSTTVELGRMTTDGLNFQWIDVNIPNSSVAEANIILLSGNRMIDVILRDPFGGYCDLSGSRSDIYFTIENKYALVKMISPTHGNWQLGVKGVQGDQVKINLIYNYVNISLDAYFENANVKKGQKVTVVGKLQDNEGDSADLAMIETFNAELVVSDDTGIIDTIPMTRDDTLFKGEYQLPSQQADLNFVVQAAGSGFYRYSPTLSLHVENEPPEIIQILEDIQLLSWPFFGTERTILLDHYFVDPDDASLHYEVSLNNDDMEVETAGNELIISSKKMFSFGNTRVTVTCTDPTGQTVESTFYTRSIPVLLLVCAVALIAAIIACIPILFRQKEQKNRMFKGSVKCVVIRDGIHGQMKKTNLTLYKGKVTVKQFIHEDDQDDLPELSHITFTQIKNEYALAFVNQSSYEIRSLRIEDKTFKLNQESTITIHNKPENITIRFTYTL